MKKILPLLIVMLLLLTGCTAQGDETAQPQSSVTPEGFDISAFDLTFSNRELSGEWESREAVTIAGDGSTAVISGGAGAALKDGVLNITKEGVYLVTGSLTDVRIHIEVTKKEKVQLVLRDAQITNSTGPAIVIEEADKVFITVPADTSASLSDAETYYGVSASEGWDGVIFSRADLCLNGSGALTINALHKHGVVSKDDLVIAELTLNVSAASTALDGKDCVKATDANITVTAGTNGIRSNNDEDADRGFIYLQECTITIDAGNDAVQAENAIITEDTILNILSGGGQTNSVRYAESGSWKGLKAGDIRLNGGSCFIDSRDDAIHANRSILITSGSIILASGDDGIHADKALTIEGGDIRITGSYEGLEASTVTIAGGVIDVTASDDGLNAAGDPEGTQTTSTRQRRGMMSNGIGELIISGGYIHVNASGDGVDSNGSIAVSGGVTLVSGPVGSGNAAFDYDGTAKVTGGVLIAAGPSGMAQNFSEAEGQGSMLVSLGQRQSKSIALLDAEGSVVVSFTPANAYQSVVITAPAVQQGQTYSVVLGGSIDGADAHGFAQSAAIIGGTSVGSVTMNNLIYGGSGGMRNRPGGGGGGWRGW